MASKFYIYNTLSRSKEEFIPYTPPHVGLYVCGPTVYGDPHLGHARPAITYDILQRYLKSLGYKVRYVRNITDVGHLERDGEDGEDRLQQKARLEELEPMEIAHYYTTRYNKAIERLGVIDVSIEPHASGHIIEQIEMVKKILERGYAYVSNGSVYFDVERYNNDYHYGKLSGRILDDMRSESRSLDGGSDKRSPFDFALWKKASSYHIMRWPSPWSDGFPGWHLECSAMSTKYLGERFDIHAGGIDLLFPHHECEIAQNVAASGHDAARYWMHNNMLTVNGQKMGKSLGNFITLDDLFTGNHAMLERAYSPMTIRFFTLQAHYRSTLDFSNEALQAAEKGFGRLMKSIDRLDRIITTDGAADRFHVDELDMRYHDAMNDDLNSPMVISALFDFVTVINDTYENKRPTSPEELLRLKTLIHTIVFDVLGFIDQRSDHRSDILSPLVNMMLDMRMQAKSDKNWALSDKIRDDLTAIGIRVMDRKDGYDWEVE